MVSGEKWSSPKMWEELRGWNQLNRCFKVWGLQMAESVTMTTHSLPFHADGSKAVRPWQLNQRRNVSCWTCLCHCNLVYSDSGREVKRKLGGSCVTAALIISRKRAVSWVSVMPELWDIRLCFNPLIWEVKGWMLPSHGVYHPMWFADVVFSAADQETWLQTGRRPPGIAVRMLEVGMSKSP